MGIYPYMYDIYIYIHRCEIHIYIYTHILMALAAPGVRGRILGFQPLSQQRVMVALPVRSAGGRRHRSWIDSLDFRGEATANRIFFP